MEIDLKLCDECGARFDAFQACCDALGEPLSIEVLYRELCAICVLAFRETVDL